MLLFSTAFDICQESVYHFIHHQKVASKNIVLMSLLSLFLNILNLKITHNFSGCSGGGHCSHSIVDLLSDSNEIIQSVGNYVRPKNQSLTINKHESELACLDSDSHNFNHEIDDNENCESSDNQLGKCNSKETENSRTISTHVWQSIDGCESHSPCEDGHSKCNSTHIDTDLTRHSSEQFVEERDHDDQLLAESHLIPSCKLSDFRNQNLNNENVPNSRREHTCHSSHKHHKHQKRPKDEKSKCKHSHHGHHQCHSDKRALGLVNAVRANTEESKQELNVVSESTCSKPKECHSSCSHSSSLASQDQYASVSAKSNLKAMILHMVFDIFSSLIVLMSSILVRFFDVHLFDSISCFTVSIAFSISGFPLFYNSIKQLMPLKLDFNMLFDQSVLLDAQQLNKASVKLLKNQKTVLLIMANPKLEASVNRQNMAQFCKTNNVDEVLFGLKGIEFK